MKLINHIAQHWKYKSKVIGFYKKNYFPIELVVQHSFIKKRRLSFVSNISVKRETSKKPYCMCLFSHNDVSSGIKVAGVDADLTKLHPQLACLQGIYHVWCFLPCHLNVLITHTIKLCRNRWKSVAKNGLDQKDSGKLFLLQSPIFVTLEIL